MSNICNCQDGLMKAPVPLSKTQRIPDAGDTGLHIDSAVKHKIQEKEDLTPQMNHGSIFLGKIRTLDRAVLTGLFLGTALITLATFRNYSETLQIIDSLADFSSESTKHLTGKMIEAKKALVTEIQSSVSVSTLTKKLQEELFLSKKKIELLQSQSLSQQKLNDLSTQSKDSNEKLKEMLRVSQVTLEDTRKQLEVLSQAHATLNEEVGRLRFLQNETSQAKATTKLGSPSPQDNRWTAWISSEDVNSFCRESIERKAMIPLAIEGKVSGSGVAYRFFLIPNLYQLRWGAQWGLPDEALVRQVSYYGGRKYFELSRQLFMVNSTSPRYQVVFVHTLDMDEAKRLKEKYLNAK